MSGRKAKEMSFRPLGRALRFGFIVMSAVGVLMLGFAVVDALVSENLGTNFIDLNKTPFDDVTIPANSGVLVTPQTVQTIGAGAGASGDTSPGLEATTGLPSINNVLTAGNTSYRFQVREDQDNSFQAGDKFLVEVSEDAALVASLYMKQDTVDDLNLEGVTVEVDLGPTAGAMSTTVIKRNAATTLTVADGWDQKNSTTLVAAGSLPQVQTSDDDWYQQDTPYWTSFQFSDVTIPAGATITSVTIFVEHYEDDGYSGTLLWKVGTGWPSAPTEWGNTTPPINSPASQEATNSWDVTTLVNTPVRVNDMELVVDNNSNGKKSNQDYIYADVEWYE